MYKCGCTENKYTLSNKIGPIHFKKFSCFCNEVNTYIILLISKAISLTFDLLN